MPDSPVHVDGWMKHTIVSQTDASCRGVLPKTGSPPGTGRCEAEAMELRQQRWDSDFSFWVGFKV